VIKALNKVKALGVVDRSVSFGWNGGPVFHEMASAMYHADKRIPAVDFVAGLAGADITLNDFSRIIETTDRAFKGEVPEEPIWLSIND
jgi:pyruvate ferredoxin oxidoreductase alpha subunit/phenylglyoxylate dehydrogenase alpha subunit